MKDSRNLYAFINAIWHYGILEFGEFTLKSGRKSPYFFNAGNFDTGEKIKALANAYARTIQEADIEFDVLFGPAYKGIPLCVATSMVLAERGLSCGYAFNRKEEKDHGDRGLVVGHALPGRRVLLIDDVMTSGMSLLESADIVQQHGGIVVGGIVALDRQEKLPDYEGTAMQHTAYALGIPIVSVINLDDIAALCPPEYRDAMAAYRLSMCVQTVI